MSVISDLTDKIKDPDLREEGLRVKEALDERGISQTWLAEDILSSCHAAASVHKVCTFKFCIKSWAFSFYSHLLFVSLRPNCKKYEHVN